MYSSKYSNAQFPCLLHHSFLLLIHLSRPPLTATHSLVLALPLPLPRSSPPSLSLVLLSSHRPVFISLSSSPHCLLPALSRSLLLSVAQSLHFARHGHVCLFWCEDNLARWRFNRQESREDSKVSVVVVVRQLSAPVACTVFLQS